MELRGKGLNASSIISTKIYPLIMLNPKALWPCLSSESKISFGPSCNTELKKLSSDTGPTSTFVNGDHTVVRKTNSFFCFNLHPVQIVRGSSDPVRDDIAIIKKKKLHAYWGFFPALFEPTWAGIHSHDWNLVGALDASKSDIGSIPRSIHCSEVLSPSSAAFSISSFQYWMFLLITGRIRSSTGVRIVDRTSYAGSTT